MNDKPSTPLATAFKRSGLTLLQLGDLVGTSKQQVYKLLRRRDLSSAWAKRLAPHLGVVWTSLLAGELIEEPPATVEPGVGVGQGAPSPGEPLYDLDELALIGLWRSLTRTKRAALFASLSPDDMPSLK